MGRPLSGNSGFTNIYDKPFIHRENGAGDLKIQASAGIIIQKSDGKDDRPS
ncbi:MAG: hypothetical protein CM15mP42_05340 [Methanobacteriota archaeon]|nr:MAG: hypothetical protein CM15mP42_05340 [Euryarchaeota archaeon]